jgi:energy-converting hydrogenase Eha subunit A
MLSNTSRMLTYLTASLYAILGILLFFLPEQLAPVFAWKVTPFMTMTIGGWCIGNAWLAYVTARRWDWKLVYPALFYLWAFGITELIVLVAFRAKLVLVHPIAWLYSITLCVNVLTAIAGLFDFFRTRPARQDFGHSTQTLHRVMALGFVIIVGLLAVFGLFAQIGAAGTNGGVFPEVMSLFTLRSFAVFYLSLTIGALPLIWERNLSVLLNHAYAAYALVIFITLAIFVYIGIFDFANRPGQLIYVGAYFLVGIPIGTVLLREGTGLRQG